MLGVALDGVDEVGDQVGATSQLDVNPAERLLSADVNATQAVERIDGEKHEHGNDCHDDPQNHGVLLR